MSTTDIRRQLPEGLRSAAHWAGEEAAWPRSKAVEVIEWLRTRDLAVAAIEIWLPAQEGVEIPAPIIYTWDAPDREPREEWAAFVQRSAQEAAAYVCDFEWDPSDHHYQSSDPYFYLDFLSEREEVDLAKGEQPV